MEGIELKGHEASTSTKEEMGVRRTIILTQGHEASTSAKDEVDAQETTILTEGHEASTSAKDEMDVQRATILNESQDRTSSDADAGARPTKEDDGTEPAEPAKPAPVMPKRDYSDLEVIAVIPASYGEARGKMPVFLDPREKMEGLGGSYILSPSLADPVPAYPTSSRTSTLDNVRLTKGGDYANWEQRKAQSVRQKRVFGMSGRTLSFVAIGSMAFILILLATVLGVTLTMKMNSPTRPLAGHGKQQGILSNSRLAAVNWTDPQGADRSAVFYQGISDAIMVSLLDSISNEWTQSNVTEAIMNTTGASRLDVLSGTPLAAVSNKHQVTLYYLTSDNDVAEMWTSNIVAGVWYAGSLTSSLSPLRAMNGSSLSAHWQICTNCTSSLCVTYQEEGGQIQIANLTDASWQFSGPVTADGASSINGTGLALRPFTEDNGAGLYGTDPNALRLYSFDSSGLLEFKDGPATNFTWEDDIASTAFSSTVAADPSPDLAAMTYGAHGLTNSLVNYLTPDGAIMSYIYNGTTWASGQPSLADSHPTTTNFTAIATAQNMRVYALSNSSIYEYQVDSTNPLSWTRVTTVFGA